MKNENLFDRLIRVFLAGLFLIIATLWTWGVLTFVFYILSAVMLFTAITGFCGLYKLFGINTLKNKKKIKKWMTSMSAFLMILILITVGYGSLFLSKKIFLEDYNRMNNPYKQTLFLTGQNNRDEAIKNYEEFVSEFDFFQKKYSNYKPFAIRNDALFNSDLADVKSIIENQKEGIFSGNLGTVHISFEAIRPIFQNILKRNNFSLLAISLIDFHDEMEEILTPAEEKDSAKVLQIYPAVDLKLKEVEAVVNDQEIQAIRNNLNELKALAEQNLIDELSAKAAELKSSFVKVYLKRG